MSFWNEETETKKYDLLPEGKYVAEVDNVTVDATQTPNRMSVQYRVLSGDHKNRLLWQNFRLEEKSIKWIQWQLGTLGSHQEAKDAGSADEYFEKLVNATMALTGKVQADLKVQHDEYNGKTYIKAYVESVGPKNFALEVDTNDEVPFLVDKENLESELEYLRELISMKDVTLAEKNGNELELDHKIKRLEYFRDELFDLIDSWREAFKNEQSRADSNTLRS